MEDFLKLNCFNDIIYYDEPHKYYVNGENFTSVTTLLHEFEEEFNEDFWSTYKAIEKIMGEVDFKELKREVGVHNVNDAYQGDKEELERVKAEILVEWTYKNQHATFEGSTLHNYIENYFTHKVFPYPEINAEKTIKFSEIETSYKVMESHFLKFYKEVYLQLIPVKIEFIVYDLDYRLAGMVDMLFWSKKLNKLVIFDWKTNTKLNKSNRFNKLNPPLDHLDACELSLYSLQLHTYKHIIEKNTGLQLSKDCFLVWFNECNESYELIKCLDLSSEVKEILTARIK